MIRYRCCTAPLLVLAAFASAGPAVATNDGLLDPAFKAPSGYLYLGVDSGGGGNDMGRAIALQPDGKVLLLGDASTASGRDLYLFRYKPDGTPDTFGSGGKVQLSSLSYKGAAVGVAPDGKIIAIFTYSGASSPCWGLSRWNGDGTPDGAFIGNGHYVVCPGVAPVPSGQLEATSLAIAPDGSFFVGGNFDDGTAAGNDFYVMKFRASNGQNESGWGDSGAKRIPFNYSGSQDDNLNAMLLQGDGKLVLAGIVARGGGDYDTALVRLSSFGSLDSGFNGGAGKVVVGYDLNGVARDGAVAIAPAGGGKYIVLDEVLDAQSGRGVMGLMRFTADGTLDNSFATSGKYDILGFGFLDDSTLTPAGLFVQGNRRIVVMGRYAKGSGGTLDAKFGFLRVKANGSMDTSFVPGPFSFGAILHDLRSIDDHADQVPAALAGNSAGLYFAGAVQYSSADATDYDMVLGRLANDLLFANDFD